MFARLKARLAAVWRVWTDPPGPYIVSVSPGGEHAVVMRDGEIVCLLPLSALAAVEHALQQRRAALWVVEGADRRRPRAPSESLPPPQPPTSLN